MLKSATCFLLTLVLISGLELWNPGSRGLETGALDAPVQRPEPRRLDPQVCRLRVGRRTWPRRSAWRTVCCAWFTRATLSSAASSVTSSTKTPFSNYVLRVEYRFVGKQTPGGPGWAFRNSGMMLHCQPPESMGKAQDFPVSIEVQLLGGDGQHPRSTANLCTPGTHVVMGGELITRHCTDSRSKTFHGDQWVTAEVEVHGNEKIIHRVNGETVLEYERPQLDPGDADAKKLIRDGNTMLSGGYIALQAESHPVEFRKVELQRLAQ